MKTSARLNTFINALAAASRCDNDNLGGFTAEHLPAILAAIDIGLPLPAVKERPVEWKEMSAAGHEPGSWPHFVAHMCDIAAQGTTLKKRRGRIMEINDLLREGKGDERALRDEKFRLVRYVVFLKSLLDDIVTSCQKAVETTILEEDAGLAPAEKGRLTPDSLLQSFEQLCGGKRDPQTRWGALQRLLEIVVRKHGEQSKFTYTDAERQAIENRLRGIATFTLRLEEPTLKGEELKLRTQQWMDRAVFDLRRKLPEFVAQPDTPAPENLPEVSVADYNGKGWYTTEPMEAASPADLKFYVDRSSRGTGLSEDLVGGYIRCVVEEKLLKGLDLEEATIMAYESFLDLVGKHLAGSDPEYAAEKMTRLQGLADATIEDVLLLKKNRGKAHVADALSRFLNCLEPWFETWTGEELRQEDYPTEESTSKGSSLIEKLSPATPLATAEANTDGLTTQLASHVIEGVRNGSMKVEAKA